MAKFNLPFANAGVHRYPTSEEQAAGLPCGPADRKLFNGLFNRLETELGNTIAHSGQVASDDDMSQLTRAIRRGSWSYGVAGGTANALTVELTPKLEAYTEGLVVRLLISATNTGSVTFNADGLGARPVLRFDGLPLVAGDLTASGIGVFLYSEGLWLLVNPARLGNLISERIFVTPGTATYTPTLGTRWIDVEVQGAGGGGSGAPATAAGQSSSGGYGGSGAYARKRIFSGFSSVTVTVGNGGATVAGTSGSNGEASSFGSLVSAMGGSGGAYAGPTGATAFVASGGVGGVAGTSGDLNIAGVAGAPYPVISAVGIPATISAGLFAGGYGAGGEGMANSPSLPARSGGNGRGGIVVVREYA